MDSASGARPAGWCGYDGLTPLHIARAQDADDVVRWLCDLGARSTS
ncbi:ankyrin repeat domain-containing protein [Streptomyces sp. NPDC013187]